MSEQDSSFNKYKYIEDNFERAIEEGWITAFYQPIIRLANGHVCAEESLVRWIDPVHGILSPRELIPALESIKQMYRVDLCLLDSVLEKYKEQKQRKLNAVPMSVNFSQQDFYACDLVEEVLQRTEKYHIPHYSIAIEVSEGAIPVGDDYVISQLEQFRDLGFQVWMDDFGSGNFAPALLQRFHFDMLKINSFFISQIMTSESARIITSELVKMGTALGMEVVAEGVETREEVDFLNEIGCLKAQGYYYCKPIPAPEVFRRYETGTAIGFENPDELDYYTDIGKISIYDLSSIRNKFGDVDSYFDTIPMAIIEVGSNGMRLIRANKAYRKFLSSIYGEYFVDKTWSMHNDSDDGDNYFLNQLTACGRNGKRAIIDDRMADGRNAHILLDRIAVNKVQKTAAVVTVVLSVSEKNTKSDDMTYNYIARTLSEDYISLYYVNMKTEEFVAYDHNRSHNDINVETRGRDFFSKVVNNYFSTIYPEDLEMMRRDFTKSNIRKGIEADGAYYMRYRRVVDGKPIYVNLKAMNIRGSDDHILIGVNNVDTLVRQRQSMDKVKEEKSLLSHIAALSGDFIFVYSVDIDTNNFIFYLVSPEFGEVGNTGNGDDFFLETDKDARTVIHPEDLQDFLKYACNKQYMIDTIRKDGLFIFRYRWLVNGKVMHVCMKATITSSSDEKHDDQLLIGVISLEKEVLREQQFETILSEAEDKATKDQLTGVKNKRAYAALEEELNRQITTDKSLEFAIVICDLNGLKQINDTRGHQAGDDFIKEGCQIICDVFARSPVFRIGGDEFLVLAQGKDYDAMEKRITKVNKINMTNARKDKVTMAIGVSFFDEDNSVLDVFQRADTAMYENKKKMKSHLLRSS